MTTCAAIAPEAAPMAICVAREATRGGRLAIGAVIRTGRLALENVPGRILGRAGPDILLRTIPEGVGVETAGVTTPLEVRVNKPLIGRGVPVILLPTSLGAGRETGAGPDLITGRGTGCLTGRGAFVTTGREGFVGRAIIGAGRLGFDITGRLGLDMAGRLGLDIAGRLGLDMAGRLGLDIDGRLGLDIDGRLGLTTPLPGGICFSSYTTKFQPFAATGAAAQRR